MALVAHLKELNSLRLIITRNVSLHQFMGPQRPFHHIRNNLLKVPTAGARNQQRSFVKAFFRKSETQWKIIDNIPDEFALIYRNTMSHYIHIAQVVIVLGSGLIALSYILRPPISDYQGFENYEKLDPNTMDRIHNEEILFLWGYSVFVVLMVLVLRQNALRIYKLPNQSSYIMIHPVGHPFRYDRVNFKRGQILHNGKEIGILPWTQNTYEIKKENESQKVILMEQFFRRPADLHIMVGEQKDPDVDDEKRKTV